ncbi:MAG: hypothetical protein KBS89_00815 [Bacteroidales bacterium]|nr:hypothetical protein [Candidatus Egerieousia equi]
MRAFIVKPKREKRASDFVLTPGMVVTVQSRSNGGSPYMDEIRERYMQMYFIDIRKACCNLSDFEIKRAF